MVRSLPTFTFQGTLSYTHVPAVIGIDTYASVPCVSEEYLSRHGIVYNQLSSNPAVMELGNGDHASILGHVFLAFTINQNFSWKYRICLPENSLWMHAAMTQEIISWWNNIAPLRTPFSSTTVLATTSG